MKVTNKLLSDYRKELEAFNTVFGAKHGLVLKVGAMTYTDAKFTYKTEAVIGNSIEDVERAEFIGLALVMGFSPEDYGKKVTIQGQDYKFIGLKPRSPKMCCVVERISDQKRYKVAKDTMNFKLNA